MARKSESSNSCSFCGKKASQVEKIIGGPDGVNICNECVQLCNNLLSTEEQTKPEYHFNLDIPQPRELKSFLDKYVVGQEEAKKILSVAVYNHYKRISSKTGKKNQDFNDVDLQKANVLIIGPTGTGKTLLASTLAKKLNVPFAIADATTLTEAGYVGEDVENILLKLIQNADNNISAAEWGIVYVDEIDKISRKGENVSITRDVSGEGVQQALLKIIEGTQASVPPQGGRKHPNQEMLKINTENILFICGGAFVGLEKIVERRVSKSSMGFGADMEKQAKKSTTQLFKEIHPDDLIKFGLIPEFIGRLPITATLDDLDRDSLIKVVTEPRNSIIRQYQASLYLDDADLIFEKEAIEAIADLAISRKTGARGIRSIVESAMLDLMYELPSIPGHKKVVITKEVFLQGNKPIIITDPKEMTAPWPKEIYEPPRKNTA